jgi:hypothetical protein
MLGSHLGPSRADLVPVFGLGARLTGSHAPVLTSIASPLHDGLGLELASTEYVPSSDSAGRLCDVSQESINVKVTHGASAMLKITSQWNDLLFKIPDKQVPSSTVDAETRFALGNGVSTSRGNISRGHIRGDCGIQYAFVVEEILRTPDRLCGEVCIW